MLLRRRTFGQLLGSVALVSQAHAQAISRTPTPLEFRKTADTSRPYLSQVDVLGVRPGMSVDEVRQVLAREYPNRQVQEFTTSISINFRGVRISSTEFVRKFEVADGNRSSMRVVFSSPTIGNVVESVQRGLYFSNDLNAPTPEALFEAVNQKFGRPTAFRGSIMDADNRYFIFGPQGLVPGGVSCPFGNCNFHASDNLSLGDADRQLAAGNHLTVFAGVRRNPTDNQRAESIQLVIQDFFAAARSIRESVSQLEMHGLEFFNQAARPSPPPRL